MTIEEAIKKFEKQLNSAMVVLDSGFGTRPGECDRVYRERKEMAEIALYALRAQQEQENNDPLTIEELRQMDGEPVWLNIGGGVWGLVDTSDFVAWLDRGGFVNLDRLSGKVYRRKPEEGTP